MEPMCPAMPIVYFQLYIVKAFGIRFDVDFIQWKYEQKKTNRKIIQFVSKDTWSYGLHVACPFCTWKTIRCTKFSCASRQSANVCVCVSGCATERTWVKRFGGGVTGWEWPKSYENIEPMNKHLHSQNHLPLSIVSNVSARYAIFEPKK